MAENAKGITMASEKKQKRKRPKLHFGLVDADLLDNGTRHPNLVLMKLAGYFRDHNIAYKLLIGNDAELANLDSIYVSKVFTFTKEPEFLKNIDPYKIFRGGTGYYAEEEDIELFTRLRDEDMISLENDPRLPGFNLAKQMPDYSLYDDFIALEISRGRKAARYKDYQLFSIGFLTRGCVRKCPFCVNKNSDRVSNYSELSDFVAEERPMIYLWDDNFLASPNWRTLLSELQATKKPFQFRQGLDIRLMTEEKAERLSKSVYHGDFIFAFDQIKDKGIIERKLSIWKAYTKKTTKLYLFCGYQVNDDVSLLTDIFNLFKRIEVLMKYGCLGYVMRHEDYRLHPLNNIYIQIARWCNQPQFYKKMSFKEFIDRNQYWMKTDAKCKSLKTYEDFLVHFESHKDELEYYFNLKYEHLNEFG